MGDVRAVDAVDFCRRAVHRRIARQPEACRRARGHHRRGRRRDPQSVGLVCAARTVRHGPGNARGSVALVRVRSVRTRFARGRAGGNRGGARFRPAPRPDRSGRDYGCARCGGSARARHLRPPTRIGRSPQEKQFSGAGATALWYSCAVDGAVIALFLVSIFIGGVVTGIAGFAFGLVVSGIWLHILSPLQVATLIVGYGLFVQSYGIWVLRRSLNWRHVWPLAIGGAVGAPAGVWVRAYMNPSYLRLSVGVLLILYSLNGLLRPTLKAIPANLSAELGVGFLNGVLGGMTGLAGVFVTIW